MTRNGLCRLFVTALLLAGCAFDVAHAQAANAVQLKDCLADAVCAELLRPPPSAMADQEAFRLIAFTALIAIVRRSAAANAPSYACVDESSAAVMKELSSRHARLVAFNACGTEAFLQKRSRHTRYLASGEPAFQVQLLGAKDVAQNIRRAFLGFLTGEKSGSIWQCDFQRKGSGWIPNSCAITFDL